MNILVPSQLFLRVDEKIYANFAHKDQSLGHYPLFVYVRLFSLAFNSGFVSLPQRELADDVRISPRALQNALRVLVNTGYIHIENTPGRPSTYRLLLSDHVRRQIRKFDLIDNPSWYARGTASPETGETARVSGQPPHTVRTPRAHGAHPLYNVYKNNKNKKDTPPTPPLPQTRRMPPRGESGREGDFSSDFSGLNADFSRLYGVYPIKKGKSGAFQAYRELARAGDLPALDRLLEVIAAFKTDDDQWRRGYAPYLATWLRERRWDDEVLVRRSDAKTPAETTPVPERKLTAWTPPPAKPMTQLPAETEKTVTELSASLCALWPVPAGKMAIAAFLRSCAASGTLPPPSALLFAAKEYLAATAAPRGLWTWLDKNLRGISGRQAGNRKAA
jgi:hypothetical protein